MHNGEEKQTSTFLFFQSLKDQGPWVLMEISEPFSTQIFEY